jgi:restriction system protein
VARRDVIDLDARPEREIKERYASLIARVTLRTIHEVLVSTPASVVDAVTFYGYVSATDPGTGQPARPLLLNVTAPRAKFDTFVLSALDPIVCLKDELTALVSPHPYDLEPVRPLVNFDSLLARFKFVAGADVIAGLDSRPDLLAMSPFEFETFVKQLFEAMGMKAWKTQDVKDDGVDAVAVSEAPVFGGLCVIQAKRSRYAVGIDVVRALAGTMEDKRATKGVVVTTSWVTKDGHDYAVRHGRIEIMECDHLKYLCKEHLGLDVLISLPKPPPGRR